MTDLIGLNLKALTAAGRSPNTAEIRAFVLRKLDRDLPQGLESALPEELQAWLATDGWAPKTRQTYWYHIVDFYRWATRGRTPRLDWDPSEELRRPHVGRRLPRVATDAQLIHALATLDRPALRAVILAAGAGMRASEIAEARREHFTSARVLIHGKGDKMRAVPVHEDVWEEVSSCTGWLVMNHGQPVNGHWVSASVSVALRRVGLDGVSLHFFRGSFATRLARAGVHVTVIAELLGHASISTTQGYVAVTAEDLVAAVGSLPRLAEPVTPRRAGGRAPAGA